MVLWSGLNPRKHTPQHSTVVSRLLPLFTYLTITLSASVLTLTPFSFAQPVIYSIFVLDLKLIKWEGVGGETGEAEVAAFEQATGLVTE